MNLKKYVRLFLVASIPLLILGFITSKFLPFDTYPRVICLDDNCRHVQTRQNASQMDKVWLKVSPKFDVQLGDDKDKNWKLIQASTSASARIVRNVKIVSASPFNAEGYGPEVASFMGALAGRRATVKLGVQDGEKSIVAATSITLACFDLTFKSQTGEYTSQCYGDGWSGEVNYWVPADSRDVLDRLLNSVTKEINSREAAYYLYMAVVYPLFIYAFFLVSLLIWLVVRAARFVKNG